MRKQTTVYDSPVDALIAIAKHLSTYENLYRMASEDFFNKYCKGQMEDSEDFIEWANEYQHYLALRLEIEKQIQHVA